VRALARAGLALTHDASGGRWIDVDTPAARHAAEQMLSLYGDELLAGG
jgi:hypothetical protein